MRRLGSWLLLLALMGGLCGNMVTAGAQERPTITIGKSFNESGKTFVEGQSVTNNYHLAYAEEKANVDIEFAWIVPDDSHNIALAVASGNIPDVMLVNETTFATLREADMIQPLTQAFEQAAGPYLRQVKEVYPDSFAAATYGGELMALGNTVAIKSHNITWIRQDWLDKLGLPLPDTMDALIETAKAFMAADFDGNGIDDTLGFSMNANFAKPWGVSYSFAPVFNNLFGAYPGVWYEQEGNVVYGSVTPEARAALGYIAGMYKDGLMDPEFVTVDAKEAVVSGRSGIAFANWALSSGVLRQSHAYDGADWVPFLCPLSQDGSYRTDWPVPSTTYMVVSKACKYPEKVISIVEYEYQFHQIMDLDETWTERILLHGDLGVSWTQMPIALQIENVDIVASRGHDMLQMVDTGDRTGVLPVNQAYYDAYLLYLEDNTQLTGWARYKGMYLGCNISNDSRNVYTMPVFWGLTDTMAEFWTTLKAMEDEVYLKIVMGEADISAFDTFVDQWYAMGGKDIVDEVADFVASK